MPLYSDLVLEIGGNCAGVISCRYTILLAGGKAKMRRRSGMKKGFSGVCTVLPVVAILMGVLLSACGPTAPQATIAAQARIKTLKIGCIMPFTGGAAAWGLATRPVMETYSELINEDGGLKVGNDAYKIQVLYEDDGFMPAPGAAAAKKLIYNDEVTAIVGYFSAGMAAVSPVTNSEKVIFLCRTGSGVVYSPDKDPYTVFGLASNEIVMNQALAMMKAYPEAKVLCWTGTEAARQAAQAYFETVDAYIQKTYGIKSVRIYYPEGTTNYTPYIEKMAGLGTEAIFSGGSVLEIALLAKQRWGMGYKWPIGQTSAVVKVSDLVRITGKDAAQGIVNPYPAPWILKTVKVAPKYLDMANRLKARFAEKYPDDEMYLGSFEVGTNMMSQYFDTLQKAGTLDPDAVMRTFKTASIDCFLGTYRLSGIKTYGANVGFGDPCAMGKITGDQNVYVSEAPLTDLDQWSSIFEGQTGR
jgi:branched-chain amino acid transport system substrate-binding protein